MNKVELIGILPEYKDGWVMINPDQDVKDIIKEVTKAHKEFAPYYDRIAMCFDAETVREICRKLYVFCKENIEYREESDVFQTTALPTGILTRGFGDCKHYASFCGGVLDALHRLTGKRINWNYRFASYRVDPTPHHVFIVVHDGSEEIWIDPTPGVGNRQPLWQEDRKVKSMALYRNISGIGDVDAVDMLSSVTHDDLNNALQDIDVSLPIDDREVQIIADLLNAGVLDIEGNVNLSQLDRLRASLPADQAAQLWQSYQDFLAISTPGQVGNIFDNIWRGIKNAVSTVVDKVKMVALAVPRNAFLALVALNVFGYASKMSLVLQDAAGKKKLLDKWGSLGGNPNNLVDTINSGVKKKAILGSLNENSNSIGVAPAIPAWLAVAGGIIAAIMPLVAQVLKNKGQQAQFANIDSGIPAQYGGTGSTGSGVMDFIKNNPVVLIGGGVLLLFLLTRDKK